MDDAGQPSVTTQTRADVLYIGYPKAASTFVVRFLENHPDVTVDQFQLSSLMHSIADPYAVTEKPCPTKIHISKDENVAESICMAGEPKNWQRYLYVPGAWDSVKDDVIIDPIEAALRLHKVHGQAKVLLLIREQVDWLQSVYKYVMSQLPWNQRSFTDYCTTPSGIVILKAGHFDRPFVPILRSSAAIVFVSCALRISSMRQSDLLASSALLSEFLRGRFRKGAKMIPMLKLRKSNGYFQSLNGCREA